MPRDETSTKHIALHGATTSHRTTNSVSASPTVTQGKFPPHPSPNPPRSAPRTASAHHRRRKTQPLSPILSTSQTLSASRTFSPSDPCHDFNDPPRSFQGPSWSVSMVTLQQGYSFNVRLSSYLQGYLAKNIPPLDITHATQQFTVLLSNDVQLHIPSGFSSSTIQTLATNETNVTAAGNLTTSGAISGLDISLPPLPTYSLGDSGTGETVMVSLRASVWFPTVHYCLSRVKNTAASDDPMIPVAQFSVTAPLSAAVVATRTASTTTVVVASGASSAAASDLQSLAVLGFMKCSQQSTQQLLANYHLLAPTALSDTFLGVVLGNLVLLGGVCAIQGIVIAIRVWGWSRSLSDASSDARFPSLALKVLCFAYQSTGFSALQLLKHPGDASDIMGGLLGAIMFIATPVLVVVVAARYADGEYAVYTFDPKYPFLVRFLFFPAGQWQPKELRRRFGTVISWLRRPAKGWVLFPLASATTFVLLGAPDPSSLIGCKVQFALIALTQVAFVGVALILRPHRCLMGNLLQAISNGCLALVAIGMLMTFDADTADEGRKLISAVAQTQLGFTLLRVLQSLSVTLLEKFMPRSERFSTPLFSWTPPPPPPPKPSKKSRKEPGGSAGIISDVDLEEPLAVNDANTTRRRAFSLKRSDFATMNLDASTEHDIADEIQHMLTSHGPAPAVELAPILFIPGDNQSEQFDLTFLETLSDEDAIAGATILADILEATPPQGQTRRPTLAALERSER